MMQQEKEELKLILSAIVSSLGNSCSEYLLRKTYQSDEGENIDVKLRKLNAGTLTNFLQAECRSAFQVSHRNGNMWIERMPSAKSQHLDHFTKSGQRFRPEQARNFPTVHPFMTHRPPPMDFIHLDSMLAAVLQQNIVWFDTSRSLLNRQILHPLTSSIICQQMNLFTRNIRELGQLRTVLMSTHCPPVLERRQVQHFSAGGPPREVEKVRDGNSDAGSENKLDAHEEEPAVADPPPDVIQDASFEVARPKMIRLAFMLQFGVRLTTVKAPSDFWFYSAIEELSKLMREMKEFYEENSESHKIPRGFMKEGLMVAVELSGGWNRARIVTFDDAADVLVEFVDKGAMELVNVSKIRFLRKNFAELPRRALRGCLVGISPPDGDSKWSSAACECFSKMVKGKSLMAVIRNYREADEVYELDLFESNLKVAKQMVDDGQAVVKKAESSYFGILV